MAQLREAAHIGEQQGQDLALGGPIQALLQVFGTGAGIQAHVSLHLRHPQSIGDGGGGQAAQMGKQHQVARIIVREVTLRRLLVENLQHADALPGEAQGNRDDGVGPFSGLLIDPFEVRRIGGHVQRAIDLAAAKRLAGFASCAGNGYPLAGTLAPFFEQLAGLGTTRGGEEEAGSFGVVQQYGAIGRVGHAAGFLQNRLDQLLLIDLTGQISGSLQERGQFFFGQIAGTHHCFCESTPTQPRPANGMAVAITVMNATLASSGRLAI